MFACGPVMGDDGLVDAGVGVGIVLQMGKPKWVVNLAAVTDEGVKFDASMLNLADVRR